MQSDKMNPNDTTLSNEKAIVEHHNDVLADNEILHEAYRAENNEHEMGMWEAAKTHPQACFWAFIMAFTIVGAGVADSG